MTGAPPCPFSLRSMVPRRLVKPSVLYVRWKNCFSSFEYIPEVSSEDIHCETPLQDVTMGNSDCVKRIHLPGSFFSENRRYSCFGSSTLVLISFVILWRPARKPSRSFFSLLSMGNVSEIA